MAFKIHEITDMQDNYYKSNHQQELNGLHNARFTNTVNENGCNIQFHKQECQQPINHPA